MKKVAPCPLPTAQPQPAFVWVPLLAPHFLRGRVLMEPFTFPAGFSLRKLLVPQCSLLKKKIIFHWGWEMLQSPGRPCKGCPPSCSHWASRSQLVACTQEASLNSCPLQRKMTGVHLTHPKGVFHCQEHPTGQRRKTRARGQLQAGEDSKMKQGAQSRVQVSAIKWRRQRLKAQISHFGGQRGLRFTDKGTEE